MKATSILCCSLLLLGQVASAKTPDPANGKLLFEKNTKCLSCHGTDVFTRPDRKVKNLAALESKVRQCDSSWYDDEILDVVAYLNKQYYKFNTPNTVSNSGDTLLQPEADGAMSTTTAEPESLPAMPGD